MVGESALLVCLSVCSALTTCWNPRLRGKKSLFQPLNYLSRSTTPSTARANARVQQEHDQNNHHHTTIGNPWHCGPRTQCRYLRNLDRKPPRVHWPARLPAEQRYARAASRPRVRQTRGFARRGVECGSASITRMPPTMQNSSSQCFSTALPKAPKAPSFRAFCLCLIRSRVIGYRSLSCNHSFLDWIIWTLSVGTEATAAAEILTESVATSPHVADRGSAVGTAASPTARKPFPFLLLPDRLDILRLAGLKAWWNPTLYKEQLCIRHGKLQCLEMTGRKGQRRRQQQIGPREIRPQRKRTPSPSLELPAIRDCCFRTPTAAIRAVVAASPALPWTSARRSASPFRATVQASGSAASAQTRGQATGTCCRCLRRG
ncbi:hypothetical protein DFJ73DRAFT_346083 [Zopfochytrium polystomum]|nr:hypothetical protein DFJ73DRAFT_346083 [Zopfochytrium polystomum]